jgi:hypothetical protein
MIGLFPFVIRYSAFAIFTHPLDQHAAAEAAAGEQSIDGGDAAGESRVEGRESRAGNRFWLLTLTLRPSSLYQLPQLPQQLDTRIAGGKFV